MCLDICLINFSLGRKVRKQAIFCTFEQKFFTNGVLTVKQIQFIKPLFKNFYRTKFRKIKRAVPEETLYLCIIEIRNFPINKVLQTWWLDNKNSGFLLFQKKTKGIANMEKMGTQLKELVTNCESQYVMRLYLTLIQISICKTILYSPWV